MSQHLQELIINLVIFIVIFSGTLIFVFNLKNVSKGYKIFFISYIVFWIPLKLLRDYTSVMQNQIDKTIVWLPLMIYGLVGIFIRPLADFLSFRLKNRKAILYAAVIIGIITFIPIIFVQNTALNTIQSIGVGIGASMIGTYELMFKEQYTKNRSFLTVSIMAFPPLIADFISAPIQSSVKIFAISTGSIDAGGKPIIDLGILSVLWAIGIGFYLITLIILFFVKEDRSLVGLIKTNAIQTKQANNIIFFILLCLVGFFISFIKFSNSGSIATLTIENLGKHQGIEQNLSSIQAYVSTLFSFFQLLGTIFLSMFLIRKTNKLISFTVGASLWVIYQLVISFNQNPYVYFSMAAINGFAYGILYNLILAYVLTLSFKNIKMAPMGIYQAILSIGITVSSFLISFLKGILNSDTNLIYNMIINLSLIGGVLALQGLFTGVYFMDKKIFKDK